MVACLGISISICVCICISFECPFAARLMLRWQLQQGLQQLRQLAVNDRLAGRLVVLARRNKTGNDDLAHARIKRRLLPNRRARGNIEGQNVAEDEG